MNIIVESPTWQDVLFLGARLNLQSTLGTLRIQEVSAIWEICKNQCASVLFDLRGAIMFNAFRSFYSQRSVYRFYSHGEVFQGPQYYFWSSRSNFSIILIHNFIRFFSVFVRLIQGCLGAQELVERSCIVLSPLSLCASRV